MPRVRKISYRGESMSISEWARRAGISRTGMLARLKRMPKEHALLSSSDERAVLGRSKRLCLYQFSGRIMTAEQIAREEGTTVHAIHERVRRGSIKRHMRGPQRRCGACGRPGHYATSCKEQTEK